jgi:hypothetical protein
VRGKKVRAGETHTLSFDVSAACMSGMTVTVEDGEYTRYLDEHLTLTGEDTHYSFDVTIPQDMTVDLKFQLGGDNIADGETHSVKLRNISWE